jgi:RNA polymerase primary sigma factor
MSEAIHSGVSQPEYLNRPVERPGGIEIPEATEFGAKACKFIDGFMALVADDALREPDSAIAKVLARRHTTAAYIVALVEVRALAIEETEQSEAVMARAARDIEIVLKALSGMPSGDIAAQYGVTPSAMSAKIGKAQGVAKGVADLLPPLLREEIARRVLEQLDGGDTSVDFVSQIEDEGIKQAVMASGRSRSVEARPRSKAPKVTRRVGTVGLRGASTVQDGEVDADTDSKPSVADRMYLSDNVVADYLRRAGKVELLKAEEEVDLAKRIEAGVFAQERLDSGDELDEKLYRELRWIAEDGRRAKDHLIEANLRLVVPLAKRHIGNGMDLIDLIQEGNLGLMRAAAKFDFTKGYKFSTYATWWIRQAITRGLQDRSRTIRVPVWMCENISRVNGARRRISQDLGREPTSAEIAEDLRLPLEKVMDAQKYDRVPRSLNTPVGELGIQEFGSLIWDTDEEDPSETVAFTLLPQQLSAVLNTLPDREASMIRMRYGLDAKDPMALEEIGVVFGIDRSTVSKVLRNAILNLKDPSRSGVLRDYYD